MAGPVAFGRMLRAELALQAAGARADVALHRLGRTRGPLVVGPWTSEVGFEVLYWIPLLRWWRDRHGIDPARLTAITRGGAGAWYRDVTDRTVEVFDVVGPDEVRAHQHLRAERRHLKQTELDELDRLVLERTGLDGANVVHPSLMYALFAPLWARRRPATLLERRTRFAPLGGGAHRGQHVAVKVYWSGAFPDRASSRELVDRLVARLAQRRPVVVLATGDRYDEHRDWTPPDLPGVSVVTPAEPATNLVEQSDVIASASLLLTVHGGFAHLGPFLGTPTVALHDGHDIVQTHEDAIRHAVRALDGQGGANCVTIDVADVRRLGELLDPGTEEASR